MIKSRECRYRQCPSECCQEMGMLIADSVACGWIGLVDKVIVITVEFLGVDAYYGS